MVQFDTEVVDIVKRTPGVKSFRFALSEGVDFKPGQFFFVEITVDGEKRTKHFSFSNSPTEKGYVEFTKRITQSPFSRSLDGLKKGDKARLKMPYGSFTFEEEHAKAAFLTGGIGITPFRSMCKFATDRRLVSDIVLLYGNNREEDIIFREDLDNMASDNSRLRVVYTLTAPDMDRRKWQGRVGYIDASMIKEETPDYSDRIFYLCGPPAMVEKLGETLENDLGLGKNRIKRENFTGY